MNDEAHGRDFQERLNDEYDREHEAKLIEHFILLRQILAVLVVHGRQLERIQSDDEDDKVVEDRRANEPN